MSAIDGLTHGTGFSFVRPVRPSGVAQFRASLSLGACWEIIWQKKSGGSWVPATQTDCDASVPADTCGTTELRIVCAYDESNVLWSGELRVKCPRLLEVVVHPDDANNTRAIDLHHASGGSRYFVTDYNVTLKAILKAVLDDQDGIGASDWCDSLTWVSESASGSQCAAGDFSTYGVNKCSIQIDADHTKTICLKIVCCNEDLWSGKVEAVYAPDQCEECASLPDVQNLSSNASPATAAAPGMMSPPLPTTGAYSPLTNVQSAGPLVLTGKSGLAKDFTAPAGNDLNFAPKTAYSSRTRYDGNAGYGWVGDYNQSVRQWMPDSDLVAQMRTGGGKFLTYPTFDGTNYQTASGGRRTLLKGGGTWTAQSLVDNRTWEYDNEGSLNKITAGKKGWNVAHTIISGFEVPSVITDSGSQRTSLAYDGSKSPPRITKFTQPGGRETEYEYDGRNLVSFQPPGDNPTEFRYDDDDNPAAVILPGGGRHSYTFDDERRLTSWKTPGGAETTYEYVSTVSVRQSHC